ncbi:MAG: glycosyltransferase family A protein [Bryobacteraceae bacterium]
MPRVSVVIPTHDRRSMLERALASVESQTFCDFEIVVADDGSSDGTGAWLHTRLPAASIVASEKPKGAAAARNRAIERSSGEIIAFLDDDDVWHPSFLEVQVAQLDANLDADLASTGHVEVDASGARRQPILKPLHDYPDQLTHLLAECPIHTLSVVACRRSAFTRAGMFDESLSIVHDLEWYVRLIAGGGRTVHRAQALVERSVPGGLVTKHRHWFDEERSVHGRAAAALPDREQRWVRAARALLFARAGLANGDPAFAAARLAEAFASPVLAARIAALAMWRRLEAR